MKPFVLSLLFAQQVGAGGTVIAQDTSPAFLRADRETVIAEITAAGFVLDRTHTFLCENHFQEFKKP